MQWVTHTMDLHIQCWHLLPLVNKGKYTQLQYVLPTVPRVCIFQLSHLKPLHFAIFQPLHGGRDREKHKIWLFLKLWDWRGRKGVGDKRDRGRQEGEGESDCKHLVGVMLSSCHENRSHGWQVQADHRVTHTKTHKTNTILPIKHTETQLCVCYGTF